MIASSIFVIGVLVSTVSTRHATSLGHKTPQKVFKRYIVTLNLYTVHLVAILYKVAMRKDQLLHILENMSLGGYFFLSHFGIDHWYYIFTLSRFLHYCCPESIKITVKLEPKPPWCCSRLCSLMLLLIHKIKLTYYSGSETSPRSSKTFPR